MSDKWRASVCSIGGEPVAVVDVEIRRTLFIDPQLFERLQSEGNEEGLRAAGLAEAVEFIREIQTIPADTRRFYVTPWAPADNDRINMKPFAAIMQLLDDENVMRIVGDATQGFTGLLYVGGVERRFDMSEGNLAALKAQLAQDKSLAQQAADKGEISQADADNIDMVCDYFGHESDQCQMMYDAAARVKAEKDKMRRDQEAKDLTDRERAKNDSATSRGPRLSDSFSGLK